MNIGMVADIGGTHIRLAMVGTDGLDVGSIRQYDCVAFPGPVEAVRAYWKEIGETTPISAAAFAVATPILGDAIHLINSAWSFSRAATQSALGLEQLLVINDFEAIARALPYLTAQECKQIGGGVSIANAPMVALGPGTGLGVAALVPTASGWVPVAGEGGHMSFSPANVFETEVLKVAWREHSHISAERLLAGIGLPLLYRALAIVQGQAADPAMTAAAIGERALDGSDVLCRQVIDTFCAMLGTLAGNVALAFGAHGGVFIGGGIVLRVLPLFEASRFRQRFEEKGRFSAYLKEIPTTVIVSAHPGLIGLRAALEQQSMRRAVT